MGRNRVVTPEPIRLPLADVHRREWRDFDARVRELKKQSTATPEDIAFAESALARCARDLRLAEQDGDWIEVRKRLNSGERRSMFNQMYIAGVDGMLRVNPLRQGVAKITAFLLDWSICGPDGKVIAIDEQPMQSVLNALDAIDDETFGEIKATVDAHEEAVAAEREAEKNDRDGATVSPAISPSPSEPAGESSGSASST